MPSQSRKELLTETERERLTTHRDKIDNKTRGMNDARVKRKLSAWLQNFDDVKLILDNLPEDQVNVVLSDDDIYKLFTLMEEMLSIRHFSPIDGRIKDEYWRGYRGEVNDLDIWRSYHVYRHLDRLFDHFGHRNPFWDNYHLMRAMEKDEKFKDRITPEEKRGMKRIEKAIKAYSGKDPRLNSGRTGGCRPEPKRRSRDPEGPLWGLGVEGEGDGGEKSVNARRGRENSR